MSRVSIAPASRPRGPTNCACGGSVCRDSRGRPRRYSCPGCKRFVPWCFGADDDVPEVCDDCHALLTVEGAG